MKLTDKRLIEFLNKKYENKPFDIERFLSPSENDFRDTNKLKDLPGAAAKVKSAVEQNKHILIYGDYDCDGICSSTILYLFLKSIGANVDVFIPNRFENGYGISIDAIEEIQSLYAPDLLITVDLGITAVEEVEILKQEGVDVVITDHHIPLEEIPDCLVVDPKLCKNEYGFDGLCGAGVALKLVEGIAGREVAMKYLDICAIATVGDIVPLIDENRAIAKLGIEKINSGNCLKSLTFLKNKLELPIISSYDISFKIVPRLNACGRMDNAFKVVDFLVETDEKLLEQKYTEIESDNTLRLVSIDKGNKIIDKCLEGFDINEPSVLVQGDFHEGIIGILASRVSHEYNKPAIIFTKTEDGTLKGSGRSIDKIDIHKIISEMQDILENFGGHKMAIGVEILPENFDDFKEIFNQKISEISEPNDFIIDEKKYDILLSENDLSDEFLSQLELLEPFGCENERPVFALKEKAMNVVQMSEKAYKHFRCFTESNVPITAFSSYQFVPILKSKTDKLLSVDFSKNVYHGKTSTNILFHGVNLEKIDIDGFEDIENMSSIYNKYYSIFDFNNKEKYHLQSDLKSVIKQKLAESDFGTIVVASTSDDIKFLSSLNLEKLYTAKPFKNAQNAVLIAPQSVYELGSVKGYKNIIFLHKHFEGEHLYFSQKYYVFEPIEIVPLETKLSKEREVFVSVYNLARNHYMTKANDVIDFANKLSIKSAGISASQVLFCLIVFMELNFLEFDEILDCMKVLSAKKMELSSSLVYNSL